MTRGRGVLAGLVVGLVVGALVPAVARRLGRTTLGRTLGNRARAASDRAVGGFIAVTSGFERDLPAHRRARP